MHVYARVGKHVHKKEKKVLNLAESGNTSLAREVFQLKEVPMLFSQFMMAIHENPKKMGSQKGPWQRIQCRVAMA